MKLIRTASIVICLIVCASFLVFAINQTKSASAAQQDFLNGQAPVTANTPARTQSTPKVKHENGIHKALDDTSNSLTSPFDGIISSSDSAWAKRGVKLFFALLVYGFGLGYLARVLRVRV